ncbi:hypothetical protein CDD80_2521 [Ophiocordyceps camponoti-rufipedis]|uniref:Uncharacterized protein n=1 Tax=Ophiocordyceps camponoti-rufipedis TaxID=2004952 RepID=A0A2C5Z699_9HYPO|nr:hypothetical protein CDD80_2521 [Ophiocordyceps camponoti-rufipedis]
MQLLRTAAALLLLGATGSEARKCTKGLRYCGSTLPYLDPAYKEKMVEAFKCRFPRKTPGPYSYSVKHAPVPDSLDNYLFNCEEDGNINVRSACPGDCKDAGQGQSDDCVDIGVPYLFAEGKAPVRCILLSNMSSPGPNSGAAPDPHFPVSDAPLFGAETTSIY